MDVHLATLLEGGVSGSRERLVSDEIGNGDLEFASDLRQVIQPGTRTPVLPRMDG